MKEHTGISNADISKYPNADMAKNSNADIAKYGRRQYWTTDRIMHLLIGLALTVSMVMLVRYLSDVLLPFVVACLVAYLLQPLQRFNQRWTHTSGRILASILTVLEVTVVIGGILWLFLPSVIDECNELVNIVKNIIAGKTAVPPEFRPIVAFVEKNVNFDELTSMLDFSHIETLVNKSTTLLSESIDVLLSVLSWLLTLIYVLFILIDYPRITRGMTLIFPKKYRSRAMDVVHDVEDSMNHYFRGQSKVALCAMVFYCIGFSIIGLPLAVPMGLLVGILYMIPYFQYVTLIPVALIAFVYSLGGHAAFWPMMGKSVLVYAVSQSICDYLITPHIMGKEMGMNPAIILLSLSVWGALMGIIGMIVALPLTSLIMAYYERYISEPIPKQRKEKREDREATSDENGSENKKI